MSVSRSYIISQYKVSKTTHDFVHAKLQGLDPEHRRFFLHILCSQLLDLRKGTVEVVPGWDTLGINLPFVTIKAEFSRGFSWKPLEQRKLLTASDFAKGECRYFQIDEPVFAEILSHIEAQNASPDGSPAVNLFDGTAFNVGWSMSNAGAARSSKLMRDAARVLHAVDCPFDIDAVQEHLVQLKASGKLAAYENDRLCAQTLTAGSRREGGLGIYTPSYAPQSSGRIGELGGGLQSCSKAMKQAAFLRVDNIFNYDLRSSQGYVLLQELQLAGIDSTWLVDHLGPGVFEQRAQALGLSKGSYKKCFFSTIMGATHWWIKEGHIGAVQDTVVKACTDASQARAKFRAVVRQLAPLKALVKLWTEWLLNDPACPHRKKTQRREFVENAAGQKLILDRERDEKELRREVAAHMLQGQEAAYIHHLTLLAGDHGFIPVSNQHDGLVTVGAVPEAARKEAAELSGFKHAFLDKKSFL
ncbi:MAG: hypothetical protein U0270_16810 [Labilithrix sp.]